MIIIPNLNLRALRRRLVEWPSEDQLLVSGPQSWDFKSGCGSGVRFAPSQLLLPSVPLCHSPRSGFGSGVSRGRRQHLAILLSARG